MPRDHGRLLCRIWSDEDFRALPRTAQMMYAQLLSQKEINNAGVLPMRVSKWAKGCAEMNELKITADLAALMDAEFIHVDTDSEEVLVRSFIRNDGVLKQPNIFKNALRCAESVESAEIRRILASELRRTGRMDAARVAQELDPRRPDPDPGPNPSETLREDIETPAETLDPSETLSEPFPEPCGVGEGVGEGEGERSVVGHLGGVRAHAHTRDAHASDAPTPKPPSRFCPRHPNGTEQACWGCQSARKEFEAYEAGESQRQRKRAAADRETAQREAGQRQRERAAAIAACGMCNEDGYVQHIVCTHDPERMPKPGRGAAAMELVRAARGEAS